MTIQTYKFFTTYIIFAPLILLLSGCSSNHHRILGSDGFGWDKTPELNIRVIQDLRVNDLRIRQVRMNNTNCKSGYKDHIELQGPIGPDSTKIIERIFKNLPKCIHKENGNMIATRVYLSSGGGLLADGFAMGNLFRKVNASTKVTGRATCASSCAIAFLGGRWRDMSPSTTLLFHAPYTLSNSSVYALTPKSIDCSDRGQVSDLKSYYFKMLGADDARFLLDRTLE
jgi:hypothetical protein